MSLDEYRSKRDFKKTDEPSGGSNGSSGNRFVIQKHDSSSLHYDFRLQVGETLKSWAVPKGPTTDPSEKRLAIRVEDHPLEYADFEGVIPEGEYGAGTVIVWDEGSYQNKSTDEDGPISVDEAIENGKLLIALDGQKISGGYALIRSSFGNGDDDQWLLVKQDDESADARRSPTSTEPESVRSGKTNEELADEGN